MKIDLATKERFAEKVRKDSASGCWLWMGSLYKGYGTFSFNGKNHRVHRLMMELINKRQIPSNLEVHHKCRGKNCCNPAHLAIVTLDQNRSEATRAGGYKGENNANAKLSETVIPFIRILHDFGETGEEIAERFPVSRRMVFYILSRRYWGHLEFPENLPPVTPESARETIERASRVLVEAINVFYRRKGRAVPEKLLNTLAACERVLGK